MSVISGQAEGKQGSRNQKGRSNVVLRRENGGLNKKAPLRMKTSGHHLSPEPEKQGSSWSRCQREWEKISSTRAGNERGGAVHYEALLMDLSEELGLWDENEPSLFGGGGERSASQKGSGGAHCSPARTTQERREGKKTR